MTAALNPDYTPGERERFRQMRVVILSPVQYHYPLFWQSAINMVAYSWHHGLRVEELAMVERGVVDWAREELATAGLAAVSKFDGQPFTHFLWLDSDHVFNRDMALELARHGVDMVSAIYFNRNLSPKPVCYVRNPNDPTGISHFPVLNLPPELCSVDAFGFGACLTSREVFEKVPKPWFGLDAKGGEDIRFCSKAKSHGFRLWADGRYALGHIGDPRIIGYPEYLEWFEANKDSMPKDEVNITIRTVKNEG